MPKMSSNAVDGVNEPIKCLFVLHEGFHLLDFTGPLSVLNAARHNPKDSTSEAFDCSFAAAKQNVMSSQGVVVQSHMSWKEAKENIDEYDILIVPGGKTEDVLKVHDEPIPIIEEFIEQQQSDASRERTLMSVCTGSLFLAKANALKGLSATTHPDFDIQLEKLCQSAAAGDTNDRTDVMQDVRYVVNNARFDLVPEEEDSEAEGTTDMKSNPFVLSKSEYLASRQQRRRSSARKGSFSFKESNMRRESISRRQNMRLGGLRVITSGGVMSGVDAALYLVSAHVSVESAEEVAKFLQYNWTKGVVVNSIDV